MAQPVNPKPDAVEPEAIKFLKEHEVAVLSTVERTGTVHGATIYYFLDDQNRVCMVTKSGTQKARDIFANQQVALTVFEAAKAQTVQLNGLAAVVTDPETQQKIMNQLIKLRSYEGEMRLPPVTTIHEEAFVALQITPTSARFTDYKQRS
jgi:general stress protein 26